MKIQRGLHLSLFLIVGVWGIDEIAKLLAESRGIVIVNQGAALGIIPGLRWEVVSFAVLVFMIWYWQKIKNYWEWLAWGMIVSGGISNLIDRFTHGGVRDYIYYPIIQVRGNLADIVIVVGVALLIWSWFREDQEGKDK